MPTHRNRMKHIITLILAAAIVGGCANTKVKVTTTGDNQELTGAWRSHIHAESGVLSAYKNLEFMLVFNDGGTMTESSNYDALPPVPPAYGVWKKTGDRAFEAHYEFFLTREVMPEDSMPPTSGWLPGGRGVLTETITLAEDGKTFDSKIHLDLLDTDGNRLEDTDDVTSAGTRIDF